jgi:protein-disulfide isomerase
MNAKNSAAYFVIVAVFFFAAGAGMSWFVFSQTYEEPEPTETPVPPTPTRTVPLSEEDDPTLGPDDAPVTIIEFYDYACTNCKRFHDEVFRQVIDEYGDEVRFVMRDAPLLSDASVEAANAAGCALEQDAFWEYHDLLFENQGAFSTDDMIAYGEQVGIENMDAFTACVENRQRLKELQEDERDRRTAQVLGTPTFFVGGQYMAGFQSFEEMQAAIDQALAR